MGKIWWGGGKGKGKESRQALHAKQFSKVSLALGGIFLGPWDKYGYHQKNQFSVRGK